MKRNKNIKYTLDKIDKAWKKRLAAEIEMKTNKLNTTRKEVIDNVVCVHTGSFYYRNSEYKELIDFYDKDGNRFYTNTDGIENAERIIAKLRNEGKRAIIGPKAPWRDNTPSGLIPNKSNTAVGIYIIRDSCEET